MQYSNATTGLEGTIRFKVTVVIKARLVWFVFMPPNIGYIDQIRRVSDLPSYLVRSRRFVVERLRDRPLAQKSHTVPPDKIHIRLAPVLVKEKMWQSALSLNTRVPPR